MYAFLRSWMRVKVLMRGVFFIDWTYVNDGVRVYVVVKEVGC